MEASVLPGPNYFCVSGVRSRAGCSSSTSRVILEIGARFISALLSDVVLSSELREEPYVESRNSPSLVADKRDNRAPDKLISGAFR